MEILQFGEFQVDASSRTLRRQEEVLPLNRRAFDVLLYLVRNPGRVLSKEELLRNVWPDAFVDENSLVQSISVLRKALAEKPGENGYILTVPGRGYQFTCPVRNVVPENSLLEPEPPAPQSNSSNGVLYQEHTVRTSVITEEGERYVSNRHRVLIGLAVALALAGVTVAAALAWRHWHRISPSPLVVISDLENATGESGLSQVLDSAVATDLKQSPYLSFLSPAHVQETLAQMQQKKDTVLTPELAREVCQRNNAQVVLRGVVAKFGQRYLLTLDATDCVSGDIVASSKREAAVADDIPHAVDEVAAEIRSKLGESRASIHRFGTALFEGNTGSLEALRNYSAASHLGLQGRYNDAIPLFQRAIELDPKFAVAYADLAAAYRNVGELALESANLTKAYELRDSVNEQDRLFIVARYQASVTGDLNEGLRNYQTWINIYPRNTIPWGNMADLYIQIGQPDLAIVPARRSLELNPQDAVSYVILSRALMRTGQFDQAKSICEQAVAKSLDGDDLHSLLMQIAVARGDSGGVEAQLAWGKSHVSATRMRLNEALLAFAQGKIEHGQELFTTISAAYKQQGLTRLYTL